MDAITRQEESYNDARFNESYEHRYGGKPAEETTTCKFCGEPVDEEAEYVDACSFCIEEMKDMLTEPLAKYVSAIDIISRKGIYEWLKSRFLLHGETEYDLICLIEEVVSRKDDELWEERKKAVKDGKK